MLQDFELHLIDQKMDAANLNEFDKIIAIFVDWALSGTEGWKCEKPCKGAVLYNSHNAHRIIAANSYISLRGSIQRKVDQRRVYMNCNILYSTHIISFYVRLYLLSWGIYSLCVKMVYTQFVKMVFTLWKDVIYSVYSQYLQCV